jgi:hypothetical protein
MVALVPGQSIEAARTAGTYLERMTAPGWTGLSSTRGDARDLIAFSTGGESRQTALEGWRTDAQAWTATVAGADVRRVGAQQVRVVRHGARVLIESDREVSIAFEYSPARLTAVVQGDGPARMRIHAGRAPTRTMLNGNVVSADYEAATGMISMAVPAGTNAIAISWTNDR